MKVLFLMPGPTWPCGVSDYTCRLMEALEQEGVAVALQRGRPQHPLRRTRSRGNYDGIDLVHLQYPMSAFGASLVPHRVALRSPFPVVTTLHEFSEAHVLRRASMLVFGLSDAMIFTNEFERAAFDRWVPVARHRRHVIPIGSNIPWRQRELERVPSEVVFFGLIRPEKGLEEFLALAALSSKSRRSWSFRVVGAVPKAGAEFFRSMQERTSTLGNVHWDVALSPEDVSQRLSRAAFAYLCYPDGASERRGSLLAAMGNGVFVLTTKGRQTPADLSHAVCFVKDPTEALQVIEAMASNPAEMRAITDRGAKWVATYSWKHVAAQHVEVYQNAIFQDPASWARIIPGARTQKRRSRKERWVRARESSAGRPQA